MLITALMALVMSATTSPAILTAHWWIPIAEAAASPKEIWLDALSDCESQGSTTIKVLDTDGYYSYGLFQFHQATFLKYGKKFGTTKENIFDPLLQRMVAREMLDNGGSGHWWNCNKSISKILGKYPSF